MEIRFDLCDLCMKPLYEMYQRPYIRSLGVYACLFHNLNSINNTDVLTEYKQIPFQISMYMWGMRLT